MQDPERGEPSADPAPGDAVPAGPDPGTPESVRGDSDRASCRLSPEPEGSAGPRPQEESPETLRGSPPDPQRVRSPPEQVRPLRAMDGLGSDRTDRHPQVRRLPGGCWQAGCWWARLGARGVEASGGCNLGTRRAWEWLGLSHPQHLPRWELPELLPREGRSCLLCCPSAGVSSCLHPAGAGAGLGLAGALTRQSLPAIHTAPAPAPSPPCRVSSLRQHQWLCKAVART